MFIDQIGIVVSDYARSKEFYTQCLAPLGLELIVEIEGWHLHPRTAQTLAGQSYPVLTL